MITFNIPLQTKSGLTIASGAVTAPSVQFYPALPVEDGDPIRSVVFQIPLHSSEAEYLSDYNQTKTIEGGAKETKNVFVKEMTPAEHAAILADGTLAEVWLQQMIEEQTEIGAGNTTISDPFAI